MKVDGTHIQGGIENAQVIEIPVRTETHIVSIVPQRGHTLFELNPLTGEVKKAEFESIDATLKGGVHKKLLKKKGMVYLSALNKKNAVKQFFKRARLQMELLKKLSDAQSA